MMRFKPDVPWLLITAGLVLGVTLRFPLHAKPVDNDVPPAVADQLRAVVTILNDRSLANGGETPLDELRGSNGFFISENGHVIVTYHQIRSDRLVVRDSNGATADAQVLFGNPVQDIALLKVAARPPAFVQLPEKPTVPADGQELFCVSSVDSRGIKSSIRKGPFLGAHTLALGCVEALTVKVTGGPGDSGSLIVDSAGSLMGVANSGSEGRRSFVPSSFIADVYQKHKNDDAVAPCAIYGRDCLSRLLDIWGLERCNDEAAFAEFGVPLLILAACDGNERVISEVLGIGTYVDAGDAQGNSAMHYAIAKHNPHVIETLIRGGASPERTNKAGWTPLAGAIHSKQPAAIQILLAAKADVNGLSYNGFSPLQIAIQTNEKRIIEMLLANGADLEAKGPNGRTALMLAASSSDAEIIELLIDAGASLSVVDHAGDSALYLGLHFGSPSAVDALLRRGADVNQRGAHQLTPLVVAVSNDKIECVDLLVAAGAKVNEQMEGTGVTPLMVAAGRTNAAMVQCLLKHGASVDVTDRWNRTAIDYARERGGENADAVVQMLKR